MNDFLKFFADLVERFPLHLVISYNKTCDWEILIYKKGCAGDYKYRDCEKVDADVLIFHENDCDKEFVFAKAQVALKEWLLEYEGGY